MYEVTRLLPFVLLAVITMSTYSQTTNCRVGFTSVVGSCYKLVKIEGDTSYQIGLQACNSFGDNVSLATIRCAEQNQGILRGIPMIPSLGDGVKVVTGQTQFVSIALIRFYATYLKQEFADMTVEAEKQGLFEGRLRDDFPHQLIIGLVNFTDNDPQSGRFPNEREPPYTYRNWGPNQPSGAAYNETITQFFIDRVEGGGGDPGMWNDIEERTEQWGAICEEIVPTSRDGCDMRTTAKPTIQTTRHTTETPKPTTATTTVTQTKRP